MPDRGQSEIIGFVLVFTLVLATMSLITVVGLGELQDVRADERAHNAQRAFEVLADNVDDTVTGGATSRATEISLESSELYFGDPVSVTVSGHAVANPARNFSYTYAIRPIVYEIKDEKRIVYAAGATFREERSSVVMSKQPSHILSSSRSNVGIVQTRQVGQPSAVSGSSTVRVRTERARASLLRANSTTYNLTIEVDSPRAPAWHRHFTAHGMSCGSPTGGSVSCSLTTDRVYVSIVRINVLFE